MREMVPQYYEGHNHQHNGDYAGKGILIDHPYATPSHDFAISLFPSYCDE